jgi:hypothetical protein
MEVSAYLLVREHFVKKKKRDEGSHYDDYKNNYFWGYNAL